MDFDDYEHRPNGAHQPQGPERAPDSVPLDLPLGEVTPRRAPRRRRQVVGATLAALVVGAAAIAVTANGSDDSDDGELMAGLTRPGSETPGVATPLQWSVLDDQGEIGYARTTLVGDDGTIYQVSTAPGEAGPDGSSPQVLWSSTNGQDWQQVAPSGLSISDLAARDGALYALGTAPSTTEVDAADTVAGYSTDGGSTWTTAVLPVDLGPAEPGVSSFIGGAAVVAGDAGVLAAVTTSRYLDPGSLLPGDAATLGWETTAEGVTTFEEVSDPAVACPLVLDQADPTGSTAPRPVRDFADGDIPAGIPTVTCTPEGGEPAEYMLPMGPGDSFTWEELGIDPAVAAPLVNSGDASAQLFLSSDGQAFEAVDASFAAGQDTLELLDVADGFVALGLDYSDDGTTTTSLWRSADGRTWEAVDGGALAGANWVVGAGRVGDALVVVTGSEHDPVVASTTDGVSWRTISVRNAVGAADTDEVWVTAAGAGDAGVALAVTVTTAEQARAEDYVEPDSTILTSPDGVAFAQTPLVDLVGEGGRYVGWIAVTADQVLLDVSGSGGTADNDHHTVLQGVAG
jgi:hypothetical protein